MQSNGRHIETWNNCLRFISQIVEPRQFEIWFSKITPVSLQDSTLTVEVPSQFFCEYLESIELLKIGIAPQTPKTSEYDDLVAFLVDLGVINN